MSTKKLSQRPNVVCNPAFHCWADPHRLVRPARVIEREVQGKGRLETLAFLEP